ncbi:MAG: pitrilysin family protein [Candidatus Cybelea sp.]
MFGGLCFILGALVGVAPAPPITSPLPLVKPSSAVTDTTLSNGMRVILLPNALAPVATVVTEYGVGSDEDTIPGTAHATEHMMFRGTSDISATQFADIADRMGADYNAQTSNESTYYYFKIPSVYVGVALRLEADRMTGAAMRQNDWESERNAIEQEVRAWQSNPAYAITLKMSRLFYGEKSPIAALPVGTIEGFNAMHAADIASFYRAWYHPNNVTLIISGDIDARQVLVQIHQLFGGMPSVALPRRPASALPVLAAATLRDSFEFPIGLCGLLYRSPGANDADYGASLIALQVLNSGRGALADLSANGKLLAAFDVGTALSDSGATFVVGIPPLTGSPDGAADLLSEALAGYRTAGLPRDLIASAKLKLLSALAYKQASISGIAFDWAQAAAQRLSSPYTVLEGVANLSDADIDRVFDTYYSPRHQITALLEPASLQAMPTIGAKGVEENVRYTPSASEPLPDWAAPMLEAPLYVPRASKNETVFRLANGLTVVTVPESVSPTIVVKGEIDTEPAYFEPPGREGVASLTSELMQWGTASYDRKAYEAETDAIAAQVDLGSTFGATVTSEHFDRAMQLLADGMLHPGFPPAGFAVSKTKQLQVLSAAEHLPAAQAIVAQDEALYAPGDPRRRRATTQSMAAISPADVRRWYAFAFRPDLTTISIVGDVNPGRARSIVERYFGNWKAFGKRPNFNRAIPPKRAPRRQTITVKSPSLTQSQVTLKEVLPMRLGDPDYVALLLANTILSGEGTGSLLFKELRVRDGYVYSVDSKFDIEEDGATFSISYASDPKDVDRAQAAALAILRRLQSVPLDDVELERAKALLAARRILPLDSYDGIAQDVLTRTEAGETPAQTDALWHRVLALTPVQLQAALRRKLHPDAFVRVILEPGA